jgi:hypothetical protein
MRKPGEASGDLLLRIRPKSAVMTRPKRRRFIATALLHDTIEDTNARAPESIFRRASIGTS